MRRSKLVQAHEYELFAKFNESTRSKTVHHSDSDDDNDSDTSSDEEETQNRPEDVNSSKREAKMETIISIIKKNIFDRPEHPTHLCQDSAYFIEKIKLNHDLCEIRQKAKNVMSICIVYLEREQLITLHPMEIEFFIGSYKDRDVVKIKKEKAAFFPPDNRGTSFEDLLTERVNGFFFFAKYFYRYRHQDMKESFRGQTDKDKTIELFERSFYLIDCPHVEEAIECFKAMIRRIHFFGVLSNVFTSISQAKRNEVLFSMLVLVHILAQESSNLKSFLLIYTPCPFLTENFSIFLSHLQETYSTKKAIVKKMLVKIEEKIVDVITAAGI